MPKITIDISIKELAHMINNLSNQNIETLCLFLTGEGEELIERNKDLKLNKVKYLTEEEAFNA